MPEATPQADLFENVPDLPDGMRYRPELISAGEERTLLDKIPALPFKEFEFQGFLGKRRTASFGWHYDFNISDHHDAPSPWLATAGFVYVRGHGPGGRYRGHYRSDTLARWKRWLLAMRRSGRTAYVYFDNDQKARLRRMRRNFRRC